MNKLVNLIRLKLNLHPYKTFSYNLSRHYTAASDDTNNEKEKTDKKKKNEEAINKLNKLLQQIVDDDVVSNSSKLSLAKPKRRQVKSKTNVESAKPEPVEKQIVKAAKNVAESLGGNIKQTESELLTKLLNPTNSQILYDKQSVTSSLSEIVKDMKIDREPKARELSRSNQVRSVLQQVKYSKQDRSSSVQGSKYRNNIRDSNHEAILKERIDLFGSQPLGIFSVQGKEDEPASSTWKMLHERELHLAVTHPPSNYFQQMILWTEQGKIWKFPIDNEQDMEDEKNVCFTEHVFLDKHLELWCPPRGPIRHFMELVCVGLSKNPYMTVKQKREHIEWYRDYFSDKQQLLKEVEAIPGDFHMSGNQISKENNNDS